MRVPRAWCWLFHRRHWNLKRNLNPENDHCYRCGWDFLSWLALTLAIGLGLSCGNGNSLDDPSEPKEEAVEGQEPEQPRKDTGGY